MILKIWKCDICVSVDHESTPECLIGNGNDKTEFTNGRNVVEQNSNTFKVGPEYDLWNAVEVKSTVACLGAAVMLHTNRSYSVHICERV
jgi:hypothetical protein